MLQTVVLDGTISKFENAQFGREIDHHFGRQRISRPTRPFGQCLWKQMDEGQWVARVAGKLDVGEAGGQMHDFLSHFQRLDSQPLCVR